MDRASSLIFPGGKTLVGWWRQLAPYQPRGFWIGYAFLHRIEAPVNVVCAQPLDPLAHLFLQALALEPTGAGLEARLRLPAPVVQRVLADMQETGLLTPSPPDRWLATEKGNGALQHRHFPVQARQRRTFTFLESADAGGQRLGPAHFLPIAECVHADWQVDEAHRFDVAWLQACIAQSADWKQARAFPLDVEALAIDAPSEAGQHVIVDRPERVLLALILAGPAEARELLGFAVKVDGWTLLEREPVLRLPASACAILPEEPASTVWQETWRSWCRQRQLPTNEVETCALSFRPPCLEVQPPGRLVQRLQAAKSDLFKGEAWLLVGDGHVRTAAQLAVRS
jgi:hypothetical protein